MLIIINAVKNLKEKKTY